MNDREQIEFRLMSYLNRRKEQGSNQHFRCADGEIVHIYWDRHGWETEWIELVMLPEEVYPKDETGWKI